MNGAICSRKNIASIGLLAAAALLYIAGFILQERQRPQQEARLGLARPAPYYRVLTGYLHQLAAELIFARTNVFIGHAVMLNKPLQPDGPAIAQNFEVATTLHPRFLAPYFISQAFLPDLSPALANRTNSILETGIAAYPDDISLHFSRAANFFLWLDDPLKASQAFAEAAKIPQAPPLFPRLAEMFATPEGVLKGGYVSLMALRNTEKDPAVRAKYQQQIVNYERAIAVQDAVDAYRRETGRIPETLERLLPLYLPVIPVFEQNYRLSYDPPYVRLLRSQDTDQAPLQD